jgi:hypothetical protein
VHDQGTPPRCLHRRHRGGLGITRQAVYNRLHALEHRTQTDPDFMIPDLEETEEIPDLDTAPAARQ